MDCCRCEGIERQFDAKKAAKKLAKYRSDGPNETTRVLVDALLEADASGTSLLDIGGGIGVIQHELLKAGVTQAVNLEASTAYIDAAAGEAQRQGHAARITHLHGDLVDLAPDIQPADIVTLERVIFCYPDFEGLVGHSADKARKLLGLVYPRQTWWVRLAMQVVYNFVYWLKRNPFRNYLHATDAVDAVVRGRGLAQVFHQNVGPWQVFVYARTR